MNNRFRFTLCKNKKEAPFFIIISKIGKSPNNFISKALTSNKRESPKGGSSAYMQWGASPLVRFYLLLGFQTWVRCAL